MANNVTFDLMLRVSQCIPQNGIKYLAEVKQSALSHAPVDHAVYYHGQFVRLSGLVVLAKLMPACQGSLLPLPSAHADNLHLSTTASGLAGTIVTVMPV